MESDTLFQLLVIIGFVLAVELFIYLAYRIGIRVLDHSHSASKMDRHGGCDDKSTSGQTSISVIV